MRRRFGRSVTGWTATNPAAYSHARGPPVSRFRTGWRFGSHAPAGHRSFPIGLRWRACRWHFQPDLGHRGLRPAVDRRLRTVPRYSWMAIRRFRPGYCLGRLGCRGSACGQIRCLLRLRSLFAGRTRNHHADRRTVFSVRQNDWSRIARYDPQGSYQHGRDRHRAILEAPGDRRSEETLPTYCAWFRDDC
jgi:hypothetical protein